MDAITDKPEWYRKIWDDGIVDRWHAEALAADRLISEATWRWCVRELRDKAAEAERTGRVVTIDTGSRACKSNTVVTEELRQELLAGVRPLLDVDEAEKDWHPGSDGKVLDLVHPSLFPLVYGETRVLQQGGRTELKDMFAAINKVSETVQIEVDPMMEFYSMKFQWLPCDVAFIGDEGTDVKITSYVNNLHPRKHAKLYGTIEKFISLAIPLWNDVLVTPQGPRTPGRVLPMEVNGTGEQFEDPALGWSVKLDNMSSEDLAKLMDKIKDYLRKPDNPETVAERGEDWMEDNLDEVDEADEDPADEADRVALGLQREAPAVVRFEHRLRDILANTNRGQYDLFHVLSETVEAKWKRSRVFTHPELGVDPTYEEWTKGKATDQYPGECEPYTVSIEDRFRSKGLQVIVKLASVELTPEKPTYDGGSWHIEGMLNEHIVATAIYYYDVENTTTASLAFRQEAFLPEMEMGYEQGDHDGLSYVYGTESMQDEPAIQELGSVKTTQGRLLAFPNTLQHCVAPFELVDKTKPGHRRFLVLWLVDPHYRVCSTANVPPQRHDWWLEMVRGNANFGKMPQEVVDMVMRNVEDWPMSLERAKELRLELMRERTSGTEKLERGFQQYNLCEH
jgi:hypothetical protein